jgi:hypothetical protein
VPNSGERLFQAHREGSACAHGNPAATATLTALMTALSETEVAVGMEDMM